MPARHWAIGPDVPTHSHRKSLFHYYFSPLACLNTEPLFQPGAVRRDRRMTDAELVEQTLAGQTVAYEELVRRWAGRITALCHARIGCAAAADDVAQEALLRGYRMLGSLAQPSKFGAWLSRIAIH